MLAALLTASLLHGCGSDNLDDLRTFTQQMQARPQPPIEPLPLVTPYETFKYSAASLRDPFTPTPENIPVPNNNGPKPDATRPREALEAFPLDTLKMVGTLQRDGDLWSLVKAPDKVIYRIRPGNYAGQNYGRVVRIADANVELVELVEDGQGGWLERPASLVLSEESTLEKAK